MESMDPDTVLALIGLLGSALTLILGWVGRAVVKYIVSLKLIRETESVIALVDWAARQAALATEQYAKKVLLPAVTKEEAEQNQRAKLAYAKASVTVLAGDAAVQKVGEPKVETMIEAHVAQLKHAPNVISLPPPRFTSSLPPPA